MGNGLGNGQEVGRTGDGMRPECSESYLWKRDSIEIVMGQGAECPISNRECPMSKDEPPKVSMPSYHYVSCQGQLVYLRRLDIPCWTLDIRITVASMDSDSCRTFGTRPERVGVRRSIVRDQPSETCSKRVFLMSPSMLARDMSETPVWRGRSRIRRSAIWLRASRAAVSTSSG
jgi:hypothetical protein